MVDDCASFTEVEACTCPAGDAELVPDWGDELPESCVHPARITPAIRIADAIIMSTLLFFTGIKSCIVFFDFFVFPCVFRGRLKLRTEFRPR